VSVNSSSASDGTIRPVAATNAAHAPTSSTNPPPGRVHHLLERAMVLVATFASLRWGEVAGLRRKNADLTACTVGVETTVIELGHLAHRSRTEVRGEPPSRRLSLTSSGRCSPRTCETTWTTIPTAQRANHCQGSGTASHRRVAGRAAVRELMEAFHIGMPWRLAGRYGISLSSVKRVLRSIGTDESVLHVPSSGA
jgi:hypothetical protein